MILKLKTEEIKQLVSWVHKQDVKLLTLNGIIGGKSGNEFDFLSSDLSVKDNNHIEKKYNRQIWERLPIVIFRDVHSNKIKIRYADEEEIQNAYLIVSKRKIQECHKELLVDKINAIEDTCSNMFNDFIDMFNKISN